MSNIPKDGQWLFRFNTRSAYDEVDRYIQAQKFYKTLPHKLDVAEEEYLALVDSTLIDEWEYDEVLEGDTPLGGEMRLSFKPTNRNTNERIK